MQVEQYNLYGEIVKQSDIKAKTYQRTLSAHDQHRVHETKDLFESTCSYCQDRAKKLLRERKRVSMWSDDE